MNDLKINPPPGMTKEEFITMFQSFLAEQRVKLAMRQLYESQQWKDLRRQLRHHKDEVDNLKLQLRNIRVQTIKEAVTIKEDKDVPSSNKT